METAEKIALIALLILVGFAVSAPPAVQTSDEVENNRDPADNAALNDGFNFHIPGEKELHRLLPTWRIDLATIPF